MTDLWKALIYLQMLRNALPHQTPRSANKSIKVASEISSTFGVVPVPMKPNMNKDQISQYLKNVERAIIQGHKR